jgi:hypothetical protein
MGMKRRRMSVFRLAATVLAVTSCTQSGAGTVDGTPPMTSTSAASASGSPAIAPECEMPERLAPAPRLRDLRGRVAYGRGTDEVEVLDLATGEVTKVTSRAGRRGWDFDPTFSVDGDRIAYRSEFPGDAEIRVVDLRTGEVRRSRRTTVPTGRRRTRPTGAGSPTRPIGAGS